MKIGNFIGNEISKEALSKLKVLLRGHVDKDVLDYIETGAQLLLILHKRGLVTNKRLSFLRKLLKETKCTASLSYLEIYEYRNKTWTDEDRLEAANRHDCRHKRLDDLVNRIENEIHLSEDTRENIKEDIDNLQDEIQKQKKSIIEQEESVQKLNLRIKSEQLLLHSVRRNLEDLKYVIRKLYREEESLNDKLNRNIELKRTIRDELESKRDEIKGKELLEGELSRKYERITEQIRLLCTDVRQRTNEIIEIEKKMQEDTLKLRMLQKDFSKNVTSAENLKETLTELKLDLDEKKALSLQSPLPCQSQCGRLTCTSTVSGVTAIKPSKTSGRLKMIDYDGLVEQAEPLIIGGYGTHDNPPQFINPRSIAIDVNDHIYVADSKNGRVQVLAQSGNPVRKPIYVGKKFQPSSVAVSSDGQVFICDSHIIRVYVSGELLRYILPIYGKSDVRPKITGLGTTNDGSILLVDRANKQIQKFRQDGTFQRFIGGNHVFRSPFGVAVANNDDIVVSDACQIRVLDERTESVRNVIGTKGIGKGKFLNPLGLAVAMDNNVFVADCENHQIHVLDLNKQDEEDRSFGSLGTDAGFFDTPCDVAVTSDGRKIVIVEARNHRVQVLTRNQPGLDFERYISKVSDDRLSGVT